MTACCETCAKLDKKQAATPVAPDEVERRAAELSAPGAHEAWAVATKEAFAAAPHPFADEQGDWGAVELAGQDRWAAEHDLRAVAVDRYEEITVVPERAS